MGFIVGTAICYQVLFSEISDRLAEFATLKAMGYNNPWLFRVVVAESVFLALLGYGSACAQPAGLPRHPREHRPADGAQAGRRPGDPRLDARDVHAFRHPGGTKLIAVDPAELYG